MEKLSDKNIRLFYGATTHAKMHAHSLPEFEDFKDEYLRMLAISVDAKVKKFQTNRTQDIHFTDDEWNVCKKLIRAEAELLDRMNKQGSLSGGAEDYEEHCLSVLGEASGRNVKELPCKEEER